MITPLRQESSGVQVVNNIGKVAVVVGGGSGIGRATAELFAQSGSPVAIADLNEASAEATARLVREAGGTATAHACDITELSQTDDLIAAVLRAHGRVDMVASTVGWSDTTFFIAETTEYWRRIIDINLMGSINISRS